MDVPFAGNEYELTTKLAYEYWKLRGSPFGSPEVDWLAAQKTIAGSQKHRTEPFSLFSLQMGADESQHR
jgi:hypothetical protein